MPSVKKLWNSFVALYKDATTHVVQVFERGNTAAAVDDGSGDVIMAASSDSHVHWEALAHQHGLLRQGEELYPHQLDALDCATAGGSYVLDYSTRSGKSTVFYLLPLILQGCVIVVCPYKMMLDTGITTAANRRIPHAGLAQGFDAADWAALPGNGEPCVIFVTPESLGRAVQRCEADNRDVCFYCVDEVDLCCRATRTFRRAMMMLGNVLPANAKLGLLSATLTPPNLEDIVRFVFKKQRMQDLNYISQPWEERMRHLGDKIQVDVIPKGGEAWEQFVSNLINAHVSSIHPDQWPTMGETALTWLEGETLTTCSERKVKPKTVVFCGSKKMCNDMDAKFRAGAAGGYPVSRTCTSEPHVGVIDFMDGNVNTLFATEAFSRGVQVPGISQIIMLELDSMKSCAELVQELGRVKPGVQPSVHIVLAPDQWDKVKNDDWHIGDNNHYYLLKLGDCASLFRKVLPEEDQAQLLRDLDEVFDKKAMFEFLRKGDVCVLRKYFSRLTNDFNFKTSKRVRARAASGAGSSNADATPEQQQKKHKQRHERSTNIVDLLANRDLGTTAAARELRDEALHNPSRVAIAAVGSAVHAAARAGGEEQLELVDIVEGTKWLKTYMEAKLNGTKVQWGNMPCASESTTTKLMPTSLNPVNPGSVSGQMRCKEDELHLFGLKKKETRVRARRGLLDGEN